MKDRIGCPPPINKSDENLFKEMLIVLCILSVIGLSCGVGNKPTIITRFDDQNEISAEQNSGSYSSIFPTIDPDIVEDVNLTTVRNL